MEIDELLSNNLRFLRAKKGLTLDELGRLLEVTKQRAKAIEDVKFWPSLPTVKKLCQIYKVTSVQLFKEDLETTLK